jgi:hypothetical protein
MKMSLIDFHKEQIKELKSGKLLIGAIDLDKWETSIINDKGQEISPKAFMFLMMLLQEKENKVAEELYGEGRKMPLDEFTRKRFGIMDYALVEDRMTENFRNVIEAYHDTNGIFSLQNFVVDIKKNVIDKDTGYSVHLTYEDAKTILEPLQKFILREEELRNNQ